MSICNVLKSMDMQKGNRMNKIRNTMDNFKLLILVTLFYGSIPSDCYSKDVNTDSIPQVFLKDFYSNATKDDGQHTTTNVSSSSDDSHNTESNISNKSLEQNIEDYYNSVDIEFEQIDDKDLYNILVSEGTGDHFESIDGKVYNADEAKVLFTKDPPSNVVKRSVQDFDKYYRDTFVDRILEDMQTQRPSGKVKRQADPRGGRDQEITGDTVLHLRSEISDVIKSETDLKASLDEGRFPATKQAKSESYVDDIMIHPSEFLRDSAPFEDDEGKDSGGSKSPLRDNPFVRSADDSEAIEEVVLVRLDARKVLECRLPEDVQSVVWFKDGEEVSSILVGSQYQVLERRHLVLGRVGREHEGRWQCAHRGGHVKGPPLSLILMEPPSPPYLEVFGRRLDAGNVFLPAKEGSQLQLSCGAEGGRPPPKLTWDHHPPLHLQEHQQQGGGVSMIVGKLVVRRAHHNTTIRCVATHPSLPAPLTASTLLHVQYAPRFSISRSPGFGFPLEEGAGVALRCEVDSNPSAPPRWRKDEGEPPVEQSEDGFLNFTSVRREHSGWYKCSATHPLGNFSSIGYFLNVRYEVDATEQPSYHHTVSGRRDEVAFGGAVQLQCTPGSVGCWPPSSPPAGLLKGVEGGNMEGYRCAGISRPEASRLRTLKDQTLIETGGVVVYPVNGSVSVWEREDVVLETEYCSDPAPSRVMWLGAGRALQPGTVAGRMVTDTDVNSSTADCYISRLRIHQSRPSDSGEYSLVVRSLRGVAEAVFSVSVLSHGEEGAPPPLSYPTTDSGGAARRLNAELTVLPITFAVIYSLP